MIEARGVSKTFGGPRVLTNVSLDVGAGETLVVFGPNGSGKTTLLKVLAGILRPTSGVVAVAGRPPREAKGSIGYLGHEPHVYPHLTAEENLRFFASLYSVNGAGVFEVLRRVDLAGRESAPARVLSRGEQQRLGLARALLHDPDVLVVDEPFSGLDEESAARLPGLLSRPGRAVVVATHERERGLNIATHTVTMDQGALA